MSDKPRTDGQCHKCPAQTDVQAGNYSDKPFEETPCFACREVDYEKVKRHASGHPTSVENYANEQVPLSEVENILNGEQSHIHWMPDWRRIKHDEELDEEMRAMFVAMRFVGIMIGANAVDREVVIKRLYGFDFKEIASHITVQFAKHFTVQATHARLNKFLNQKDHKQFKDVFDRIVQRQKRNRKRRAPCRNQR